LNRDCATTLAALIMNLRFDKNTGGFSLEGHVSSLLMTAHQVF
jgi:hypothetical protein